MFCYLFLFFDMRVLRFCYALLCFCYALLCFATLLLSLLCFPRTFWLAGSLGTYTGLRRTIFLCFAILLLCSCYFLKWVLLSVAMLLLYVLLLFTMFCYISFVRFLFGLYYVIILLLYFYMFTMFCYVLAMVSYTPIPVIRKTVIRTRDTQKT